MGTMKSRGVTAQLILVAVSGCLLLAIAIPSFVRAQSSHATADWEKAAGGERSFDTASVKPNASGPGGPVSSNFVLGLGDQKPPNGVLRATNLPIAAYIAFAYKLDQNQMLDLRSTLPQWTRRERIDIEARPLGSNLTRDQVRLMMQSLLAGRFKLAVHFESKREPEYALVLAKAGRLGQQMRPYPDGFPCSDAPQLSLGGRGQGPASVPILPTADNGRFPASCGRISPMTPSGPGLTRQGGRDISMESIIAWVEMSGLDRPLVDRTGLKGTFDVSVEREIPPPPGADSLAGPGNSTAFVEAMERQLGLKLQSITGAVDMLVIDHIEEPTPN